jgi:probable HAF family extracellular repeat protein
MRLPAFSRRPLRALTLRASARVCTSRIACAIGVVLTLACQSDSSTGPLPTAPSSPSEPLLVLTGGAGTEILPVRPAWDSQVSGVAIGLNNLGQVTGAERNINPQLAGAIKPFRWSASTGAQQLTGCCGDPAWGNDINDVGVVVGTTPTDAIRGSRGFVAAGTQATELPILPGGDIEDHAGAIAINNAGQIVGMSPAPGYPARHAVLWSSSGVIQDLGTLGGTRSEAIDINSSAQVIGKSQIAGDAATHFFLWSSGSGMQDLNTLLAADLTGVMEINDAGEIIGTYINGSGQSHAFLYTPGSGLRDLGTLGGAASTPTGLNGRGDVVGSSTDAAGATHAFLWTATDGMEDITARSGIPQVHRLNDNMQSLTGARLPSNTNLGGFTLGRPRLVQLQVTQSNAPPTAVFTVQCNGLTCILDASGSLDDKPGLSYDWDVNKYPGPSASGALVTVTYPHASQRTVTLTATDANGLTSTQSKTFTVSDYPVAAFTFSCSGLTCMFDSNGSLDTVPFDRLWTFDDGQTAFQTAAPSHTYAQPGTYAVTLLLLDYNGNQGSVTKQITVTAPAQNQAPVASFTYSCSGFLCSLDATGSTDDKGVVSYEWSLGKAPGGSASGPTVTTDYWHAGTRTVTLTVTDADGLSSSVTQTIDVGATQPPSTDAPPVARFTSSCTGTVCTLDASTSSDDVGIASYDWSLGKAPGGSATGVSVTTDYWHTSTRTVTLTVTDTKGQTNSVTQTVTVP